MIGWAVCRWVKPGMMVGRILIGAVDQRGLQVAQHQLELVDRVAHPQAHIERDLVVARARGVQPPAGRPDDVGQPLLDVEVDVLELGRELELAALDLGLDLGQPALDGAAVLGRQDALGHQHVTVRDGARDILRVEPPVETDGGVDLLHDFRGAELVAAAPHRVGATIGATLAARAVVFFRAMNNAIYPFRNAAYGTSCPQFPPWPALHSFRCPGGHRAPRHGHAQPRWREAGHGQGRHGALQARQDAQAPARPRDPGCRRQAAEAQRPQRQGACCSISGRPGARPA